MDNPSVLTMSTKAARLRKRGQCAGQGLVEYALILVLVAIVVVGAASLMGLAAQRVYGVIAASLGAKHDTNADHTLTITTALCIAKQAQNLTGLWVVGDTSEDVSNLTGSTESAVGTGMGGAVSPVEAMGTSGGLTSYKFHPLLANVADLSVCPKAVVIQSSSGAIAVAPVTAELHP